MNKRKKLNITRNRRMRRASVRIEGTAERPRLAVNRSNRLISAQIIDDVKGITIAAAASNTKAKGTKSEQAFAIGEAVGKQAVEKGVKAVVFDRRSYRFHGRVKQLAEGAKKAGLQI